MIGWQVGLRDYNSHYLSGKNNSNDIGCLYSNYFSAFAFKIDEGKYIESVVTRHISIFIDRPANHHALSMEIHT